MRQSISLPAMIAALSLFVYMASTCASSAVEKNPAAENRDFNEVAYVIKVKKRFDLVISDLRDSIIDSNFRITNESNIYKGLGARDVRMGEYTIIEFCNLTLAEKVLKADLRFGLLMPCRVTVYEDKDEVVLMTLRPTFIVRYLGDQSLAGIAEDIERHLINIMDAVR